MSRTSDNFSFKMILDSMEDGVYIVNDKHEIQFINSKLIDEFGPVEGKKCFNYFHERTEPCPWCKNEEVFSGETVRWEWTSPKNQKTYDLIDSPLYTSNGKIFKLEIFRDITEIKKSRMLLQESQENLKNRERHARTLSYLGQIAISERDLDILMDKVVVTVAECLDVELCKILELSSDGKELLLKSGIGWKEGYTGSAKVDTGIESQAGFTLISKKPVVVEDLRNETRFSGPKLLTDHRVISGMSVIIMGQEEHYGILGAHTRVKRKFSKDDVAFLQSVADILALAIERRKTEIERQKLQNKREQFLTLTTHELRTPLTIFRGYVEFLQTTGKDIAEEKRRYCLEEMRMNCGRLENLISNAADISKIDREIFKISPITVKLNDFLDDVKKSFKLILKDEFDYYMNEEEIKIPIMGDPLRLKQIIENLVQNALNHTYKDTRKIILKVEVYSKEIKIFIIDNGVGILRENLERIFEQFISISSDLYVGGSGVGLYISRMIAEAHNGTLVAESDGLGKGTRFILGLPKGDRVT